MVADKTAPWAETVLFTADDLMRLPDDGWQYELVEGRLVRMPPPDVAHGRLCFRIARALDDFAAERGLGVVVTNDPGFIVSAPGDADTVLGPDVVFISTTTMAPDAVDAVHGYQRLAPDLVVEVSSSSQSRPELLAKAEQWLAAGVQLVWIVWPRQRQVGVWEAGSAEPTTIESDGEIEGGTVLPGFRLPVARLWGADSREQE